MNACNRMRRAWARCGIDKEWRDQMLEQSRGLLPESATADEGLSVSANPSSRSAKTIKRGGSKNDDYTVREGTGFGYGYRVNSMQYFSKNWVVRISNKTVNVFVRLCNLNTVFASGEIRC